MPAQNERFVVYDNHQGNIAADGDTEETDRYESRQGMREERSNFELSTKRILQKNNQAQKTPMERRNNQMLRTYSNTDSPVLATARRLDNNNSPNNNRK